MSKILPTLNESEISNPELAKIVRTLHHLTEGGYDQYDKNNDAIVRLLKKMMILARQEKEWYMYFDALYYMLYQCNRNGDDRMTVEYAEIYYRDSALYMDKELPNYPDKDMGYLNIYIYDMIYSTYVSYYQIDDAKMDFFMKQFEQNCLKYGKTYLYYENAMDLGIFYHDKEFVENARKNFEKYEYDLKSCYVCAHKQYFGYYLLKDQQDEAEALMLKFINRNIPKKHLWCYEYCQSAETGALYASVLDYCLDLGKTESFQYFYKKYWLKQPRESWRADKDLWQRCLTMYLCAISGNFDELDVDIREAEESFKDYKNQSTIDNIKLALMWHCYFILLDKSGVHEIEIELPVFFAADGSKKAETLAVSRYLEEFADDYGMKFAGARKKFDYACIKNTYLTCAGL